MSVLGDRVAAAAVVRVLGVGSPQGDDQAGWAVVDSLGAEMDGRAVELLRLDRPGPRLLGFFRGASHVVIVDAMRCESDAGTLRWWNAVAAPVAPWRGRGVSSHGIGVQEALALARELRQLPPRCDVLGIAGKSWDDGAGLSPAVASAVVRAVAEIRRRLAPVDL